MEPTSSFINILPNLSIGVISILALVYVTRNFLIHLQAVTKQHKEEVQQERTFTRDLEREVRTSVITQLEKNTAVMSKVMDHFVMHNRE